MSESKFTSNLVLVIVEAVIALLASVAIAYTSMLNREIDTVRDGLSKLELHTRDDIGRLRSQTEAIEKDQKLTIEKLHLEYCGIQRSLADINVAVTALNSRLLSRDDVEKIARREATLYHQSQASSEKAKNTK
jgi:hypothetical protein